MKNIFRILLSLLLVASICMPEEAEARARGKSTARAGKGGRGKTKGSGGRKKTSTPSKSTGSERAAVDAAGADEETSEGGAVSAQRWGLFNCFFRPRNL